MTFAKAKSPAAAPGPSAAGIKQQAADGLKKLLAQLTAQSERAAEQAGRLNQEIDAKMTRSLAEAAHVYGVFPVGPSRRLMVLRDVEELNGQKPRYSTSSFAAAVQFANQRLCDPVFPAHPPLNVDRLVQALQHLAKILDHIEAGNARLAGSGTAAEPYVLSGPLHLRAPVKIVFPVTPASLRLSVDGRTLRAAAASSP